MKMKKAACLQTKHDGLVNLSLEEMLVALQMVQNMAYCNKTLPTKYKLQRFEIVQHEDLCKKEISRKCI
jgi:hypothetical protein